VDLLVRLLSQSGYSPVTLRVDSEAAFLEALSSPWDVIISDHTMPRFSSTAALRLLRERHIDCPFIVVSGTISEETAVEAMRAGAQDYVLKQNLGRLPPAIARELREAENRRQKRKAEEALAESEEQLRQAQRMESIGRLAGGVAHDFNNLLTVILGFTQMLLEDPDTAPRRRGQIKQIQFAGQRASQLTRQLLAFSRQQILVPRRVDLADVVHGLAPMLTRLLGEDVAYDTESGPDLPLVLIDPGQLEQVIMNLAVNARDAMPTGGRLVCRLKRVAITPARARTLDVEPGDFALCEMSDTGHGMDEATCARVFEPFFTTKPVGQGTGLGLSTVYGIVRQSGGSIELSSTPGEGTTFRLFFPESIGDRTYPATDDAALTTDAPASGTILVAEDEESLRALIVLVLTQAGYEVLSAASAEEASLVSLKYGGSIDLLVTDVVMPGASGAALATQLGAERRAMKVLYISGYSSHGSLPAHLPDDHLAFLQKPFLPVQLLAAVRTVLASP